MKQRLPMVTVVRLALAAIAMAACGDGSALFDDSYLPTGGASSAGSWGNGDGPDVAGSGGSGGLPHAGSDAGGSLSLAGTAALGGMPSLGGTSPVAGTSALGGTEAGGAPTTGGTGASGSESAGAPPVGGSAAGGTPSGGSAGMAGTAGVGAGGAGTVVYGDPVTMESQSFSDTYVIACYPEANYRTTATLVVDSEPCQADILLKPPIAGIPGNALVKSATITLTCTNPGPGLTLFRPESDWTFDTVSWHTRPVATQYLASLGTVSEGPLVIDVTPQVQAWVEGSLKHFGVGLRTDHHDGLIFASTRATEAKHRPKLSVTYAVPLKK